MCWSRCAAHPSCSHEQPCHCQVFDNAQAASSAAQPAVGSGFHDLRTNWHAWSSRNALQQIWSSLAPCHAVSAEDPDPVACRPRALSAVKASVSTVSADCCIGGVQGRLKNPHNSELWLAAVRVEQRAGNIKAAESLMAR